MSKVSLLAIATVLLAACSGSGSGGGSNSTTTQLHMTDITDYSSCTGPTPAGTSIYGEWYNQSAGGGISILTVYDISQTSVKVTNTCYFPDGAIVPVSVTVPAAASGNVFMILGDDQNENESFTGSDDDKCSVSIEKASTTFSFVGPCLAGTGTNGQTGYLVPTTSVN
jgi:hypothetical protein